VSEERTDPPQQEPAAKAARGRFDGPLRDVRAAVIALVVGAGLSWLLGLPRAILVATGGGFAAGLAAAYLHWRFRWKGTLAGLLFVSVIVLLFVSVVVAVTLLPERSDGHVDGEPDQAFNTFNLVGEEDRWLDFDVPDGTPPTNVGAAAEGSDAVINLDQSGRIRMRNQVGRSRIVPLGQDSAAKGQCSKSTTGWTDHSIDVLVSRYLCIETSEGRLVLLHLEEVILTAQPPRVVFSWART
jgi:hypothetical protein